MILYADNGILLVDCVASVRVFRDPRNRKIRLVDSSHISDHEELRFLDAPNSPRSLKADGFINVEIRFLPKKIGCDKESTSELIESTLDQFSSRISSEQRTGICRPASNVEIHSPVWFFC